MGTFSTLKFKGVPLLGDKEQKLTKLREKQEKLVRRCINQGPIKETEPVEEVY